MKILIDIGHPAHVHVFRPLASQMIHEGHKVLFTCREKEFEKELLSAAEFQYVSFGKHYKSTLGKIIGMLKFDLLMLRTAIKFSPDFYLSHGSMYAAHIAWLTRRPHISLEDSENLEQIRLYRPFTKLILSPDAIIKELGKKVIKYRGYHVLNYLHPDLFSPDPGVYEYLQIPKGSRFFLIRLVGLTASHDKNLKAPKIEQLLHLIEILTLYGHVFISSERELSPPLDKYRISIPPHKMHDVIAFSSLLIGDSGVMSSEAAVLGVPSVVIVNAKIGVHEQMQKQGIKLHFNFFDQELIKTVTDLLIDYESVRSVWQQNSKKVIDRSINLTELIVWILYNYPNSKRILQRKKIVKNNKDYVS